MAVERLSVTAGVDQDFEINYSSQLDDRCECCKAISRTLVNSMASASCCCVATLLSGANAAHTLF